MITTGPTYPKFPRTIEIYPRFTRVSKKYLLLNFTKNGKIYLFIWSRFQGLLGTLIIYATFSRKGLSFRVHLITRGPSDLTPIKAA